MRMMNKNLGLSCNHVATCPNAYDDLNAVYLYVYLKCGKRLEIPIPVSFLSNRHS
jgi:hypothetical protein